MRYVIARYNEKQREIAYRIYVTDTLRLLAHTDQRFADWMYPQKADNRTGDEIAADIIKRAGLVVSKE